MKTESPPRTPNRARENSVPARRIKAGAAGPGRDVARRLGNPCRRANLFGRFPQPILDKRGSQGICACGLSASKRLPNVGFTWPPRRLPNGFPRGRTIVATVRIRYPPSPVHRTQGRPKGFSLDDARVQDSAIPTPSRGSAEGWRPRTERLQPGGSIRRAAWIAGCDPKIATQVDILRAVSGLAVNLARGKNATMAFFPGELRDGPAAQRLSGVPPTQARCGWERPPARPCRPLL
jgi:hypothetical protein